MSDVGPERGFGNGTTSNSGPSAVRTTLPSHSSLRVDRWIGRTRLCLSHIASRLSLGEGSYKDRNCFLEKHAPLLEAKNVRVELELLLAADIFLRGMIPPAEVFRLNS